MTVRETPGVTGAILGHHQYKSSCRSYVTKSDMVNEGIFSIGTLVCIQTMIVLVPPLPKTAALWSCPVEDEGAYQKCPSHEAV